MPPAPASRGDVQAPSVISSPSSGKGATMIPFGSFAVPGDDRVDLGRRDRRRRTGSRPRRARGCGRPGTARRARCSRRTATGSGCAARSWAARCCTRSASAASRRGSRRPTPGPPASVPPAASIALAAPTRVAPPPNANSAITAASPTTPSAATPIRISRVRRSVSVLTSRRAAAAPGRGAEGAGCGPCWPRRAMVATAVLAPTTGAPLRASFRPRKLCRSPSGPYGLRVRSDGLSGSSDLA